MLIGQDKISSGWTGPGCFRELRMALSLLPHILRLPVLLGRGRAFYLAAVVEPATRCFSSTATKSA